MNADAPRVTINPPCDQWAGLAERSYATLDERSRRFRAELGLPTDRPIVMTGHQAEWWHCGVLAKFLAVDEVCRRASFASAWVVPDQDEAEFAEVRVPLLDEADRLREGVVRLTQAPKPGTTSGAVPPFQARAEWPEGGRPALASVERGVRRLVEALNARRNETSGARQVIAALLELLAPLGVEAPVVYASGLAHTGAFRQLVARMREEPLGAAQSYNRAAAEHPGAGIAPLKIDGSRVELPLWRIEPHGGRKRVFASDLADAHPESLTPRALALTGLMRWGACDLFVHGLGGAAYDPVTEEWLREWLGAALAPAATATADVLLPLPGAEMSESDAARAAWAAHSARHNPSLALDDDAQARKRTVVATIQSLPRRSGERAAAFREMHESLTSFRASHAGELRRLRDQSERLRALASDRAVARDRTWAFFLHDQRAIESLRGALGCVAPARQPCAVR